MRKMITMAALLLALAPAAQAAEKVGNDRAVAQVDVPGHGADARVHLIALPDGTRCVVLVGPYLGCAETLRQGVEPARPLCEHTTSCYSYFTVKDSVSNCLWVGITIGRLLVGGLTAGRKTITI
jgi:hypothetical protein